VGIPLVSVSDLKKHVPQMPRALQDANKDPDVRAKARTAASGVLRYRG
jgi:hypothetical protein